MRVDINIVVNRTSLESKRKKEIIDLVIPSLRSLFQAIRLPYEKADLISIWNILQGQQVVGHIG